MRVKFLALLCLLSIIAGGCREEHLISSRDYRKKVENDFKERRKLAAGRKEELFAVFRSGLDLPVAEALKFLYAYMPLSDLADYDGEFFYDNVKIALKARNETPWGKSIPEDLFLHYVLPVRVNNENLDSFRIVYYDEIMSRIKGLDAESAALEINHWCHERVAYQPSDIRTSGPLSTILSARGRCGEESTFTVSALRSVCLPARQVYVPRWAHTDDNHAWVEVWINGNWHYMGACEPEPVLDRGWFTEPARRAMLVHTKSFGAPSNEEKSVLEFRNYSIINNLSMYADTRIVNVKLTDSFGKPVEDASVEFCIYNFSEFYPLIVLSTDKNGTASFETGYGDFLVWAHKGETFDFSFVKAFDKDTVFLCPIKNPSDSGIIHIDINPPPVKKPFPPLPEQLVHENDKRLAYEDSIRNNYIKSWLSENEAVSLAASLNIPAEEVVDIIRKSEGNYREIIRFLLEFKDIPTKKKLKILNLVSEKDLRDTRAAVLADHLQNAIPYDSSLMWYDRDTYDEYVLNPRIADEMLRSWRSYLKDKIPDKLRHEALRNPEIIIQYVNDNIIIKEEENYYSTPLSPSGTHDLGVADNHSRNIYFVALCRLSGIPARLDKGTMRPQYYFNRKWNDVYFAGENPPGTKGFLKLVCEQSDLVPEYFKNFTIARFENGRYNTLQFDYDMKISDFEDKIPLPPGYYMVVTGNRTLNDKILASMKFFRINPVETTRVEVVVRK
ncbi:MAG TPA: transglutaminase domain-containing protein [Bacteroidales bacterium]|nr:transglutaminase domain-containing protein [Bacteroidales bacterium]